MSARIAAIIAMAVAATLPGVGAKGACAVGSSHPHRCVDTDSPVNLNSVPDIANKIVSEEPSSPKQGKSGAEPAAPAPYTGPIVGVTNSGKRAPTVGYSWSLQ